MWDLGLWGWVTVLRGFVGFVGLLEKLLEACVVVCLGCTAKFMRALLSLLPQQLTKDETSTLRLAAHD